MRTWTCLAGLLALLLGLMPCPVSAAPSAYHLSKVVMLTRHGVAAPADPESPAKPGRNGLWGPARSRRAAPSC